MFSFFRCTLFTYYGVWQEIMADAHVLDFKRLLSYYHWRFAYCSFLNLLDINYEEVFCCATCGKDNSLHTVICDAKAPSFRQEHCSSLKSTYSSPSPSTVPWEQEDKLLFMLMIFLKNILCIIYSIILVPSMIQGVLF